jgi:antirestriction protein ArdC
MKNDIYQEITDQIARELEQGVRPWLKPWNAEHLAGRVALPLRHNRAPYRGINIVVLWMASLARGYGSPVFMTFKQAIDLGGGVRKGEKGNHVVYSDSITRAGMDEATGEENEQRIRFMKRYTVFNIEQIDGLPAHYYAKPEAPASVPFPRIARAEEFFAAIHADIRHGGTEAYYAHGSDHVQMPPFETFRDGESYYATLAHECTHWTRNEKRLNRSFGRKRFGDEGYAMEELVAELGSAFLCAELELNPAQRSDHASYIANWLRVLKSDQRAIFTAASFAQAAADFLKGLQPQKAAPQMEAA